MRIVQAALAFIAGIAPPAGAQTPKWDLVCNYTNGSIAFMANLAQKRSEGDMVSHQIAVTPGTIKFGVSAHDTTLLQDFEVTIDRASLKWTTNKPGWGGVCKKM